MDRAMAVVCLVGWLWVGNGCASVPPPPAPTPQRAVPPQRPAPAPPASEPVPFLRSRPAPALRPVPSPRPGAVAPRPSRVAADASFRTVLAIQTYLDRENFSCGSLDGIAGPKTRAALRVWGEARGITADGELDSEMLERLGGESGAFTTHVVSAEDAEGLVAVPESWVGKSRVAHLGYETVLERVAEQYHASENAVRRLNPQASWPHPRPGTPLVVPNPYPHRKGKAARLVIQIVHQRVVAYGADGGVLAWFPCSIGGRVEKRPAGELQVVNCAENPDYVFDPALFAEDPEANSIRGKLFIPPGPNNPVGVAWIGLSLPGYGIHGTPKPQDIGKTQSHGCFRLANWNARKLLGMIQIGMPVKMDWTE